MRAVAYAKQEEGERERRDKGKGERRRNRDGDILGSDIQSKTVNIGLAQGIYRDRQKGGAVC